MNKTSGSEGGGEHLLTPPTQIQFGAHTQINSPPEAAGAERQTFDPCSISHVTVRTHPTPRRRGTKGGCHGVRKLIRHLCTNITTASILACVGPLQPEVIFFQDRFGVS
jgi:hypothetical protein